MFFVPSATTKSVLEKEMQSPRPQILAAKTFYGWHQVLTRLETSGCSECFFSCSVLGILASMLTFFQNGGV